VMGQSKIKIVFEEIRIIKCMLYVYLLMLSKNKIAFYFLVVVCLLWTSCSSHRKISSQKKETAPISNSIKEKAADQNLLLEINKWLGVPYSYGGNDKKGVDCSGFVCAVYTTVYAMQLPRTSKAMYSTYASVSEENLQIGDLVFFNYDGKGVSHVGIYIGNHKYAHASTSKGVIIGDLTWAYTKKHFLRGGRVIQKR